MTLTPDVCFSCAAKLSCEVFGTLWNVSGIPLQFLASCRRFDRFDYSEVSRPRSAQVFYLSLTIAGNVTSYRKIPLNL